MEEYYLERTVSEADLDDLNHVNNIVYLRWVQEVAGAHWFAKAGKNTGYLWVVRKHEIEYFAPAVWGDKITLCTWVERMEGLSSFRRVEIRKGEKILCSCLTNWIMLDGKTKRPKQIPDQIAKLFI